MITESVPSTRAATQSRFSRDLEDPAAWSTSKRDKTWVAKLTRIAWRTAGLICEHVVAEEHVPKRTENLFLVGVEEISYRKHQNYLTLVPTTIPARSSTDQKAKAPKASMGSLTNSLQLERPRLPRPAWRWGQHSLITHRAPRLASINFMWSAWPPRSWRR